MITRDNISSLSVPDAKLQEGKSDYLWLIRINISQRKKLIIYLYEAIVKAHLEFCIRACRPYHKKDITLNEYKILPELRELSYEEHLKECG